MYGLPVYENKRNILNITSPCLFNEFLSLFDAVTDERQFGRK